jgi:predicted ATP-dependent protease
LSTTVSPLRRYQVNLLVDSADDQGAPVIYESNPTYLNLTGRVEQMAQMGALITDFMLIKPGMLHRANGGYLILDALKVLTQPLRLGGAQAGAAVWRDSHRIGLADAQPDQHDLAGAGGDAAQRQGVLLGDRMLYYLLSQADPDFNELFKVAADFADEVERNAGDAARLRPVDRPSRAKRKLRPLDRYAVGCRVLDHAARLVSDSEAHDGATCRPLSTCCRRRTLGR